MGDHPRSRGVYLSCAVSTTSLTGSSPLARGLLSICVFLSVRFRDHPRSRGVYGSFGHSLLWPTGSSPLARGLLERPNDPRPRRGIIPARAGFTVKTRSVARQLRDHPRSRGVYGSSPETRTYNSGSSPLARGLLLYGLAMGRRHGIIPARAGFTSAGRQGEGDARDHPRSRGVYQISIYVRDFHTGSSPLARGLRFQATIFGLCSRIIPARAGFTLMRRTPWWVHRDHPRSRGVYLTSP